jgi:FAD/FMN-containing dehydrogenase
VGDDLRRDDAALARVSSDFGGMIRRRPEAVLVPRTAADIAAVLSDGVPVTARGRGHSTHGQSLVDSGVVVDMAGLCAVHRVEPGYAVVDGGASWRTVVQATLPRGLTPPVVPDFLDLSVGGTLSLGSVGGTSHRHGAQADTVLALEVVTGTGSVMTCAPGSDLFRAVLGGLGQCGIITRATIKLVPAPPVVRRLKVRYPDTAALNAAQRELVLGGQCDYVEGLIVRDDGWTHVLEAVSFRDKDFTVPNGEIIESESLSYFDFLNRLGDEEAFLATLGRRVQPRPWCSVFLPHNAVDAVIDASLARPLSEVGASGLFLCYPIPRSVLTTPLLRVPDDSMPFQFSVFRYADEDSDADAMLAANRALYGLTLAAGGTLYPFCSVPLDHAGWQANWGAEWEFLRSAKSAYDPAGLLNRGQGIFP